jgi:hypothetical protein
LVTPPKVRDAVQNLRSAVDAPLVLTMEVEIDAADRPLSCLLWVQQGGKVADLVRASIEQKFTTKLVDVTDDK